MHMYTEASTKLQKSYEEATPCYEPILGRVIKSSHVDEGRAGDVLGDGERDEAEHGEAAVPELGVGAHDPTAPRLGALPLEYRHQGRHGQHRRRGREQHASPDPLPACDRRPPPLDASTASAETKPTMASRPLMRSGAGPLNAMEFKMLFF
jgi:hypothetical protein